jgi:multimeric flavodoxin WrbA
MNMGVYMKVVAINGSPRKDGNTAQALKIIGEKLNQNGIDFEIIHVGDKTIRGCLACGSCAKTKNEQCSQKSDLVNDTIQIMKVSDGIIIASPVYFSGIAGTMKSFLDRTFYVAQANGQLFRHKVGATVTAVRRSGGSTTLDSLNHYLTFSEMILAAGNYWAIAHGRMPGEVIQDSEAVQTLQLIADNIAWILRMQEQTKGYVKEPEKVAKVYMHFIR